MSKFIFESKKILPQKKQNSKYNKFDLSKEEIDELKAAFQIFEEEDTGKINPKNIIKIFKSLNYDKDHKNIMSMLDYLQKNSTLGLISFEQFLEGCDKFLGKNTPEEDLTKIYELFVESKENVIYFLFQPVITLESFRKMLNNLGEELSDEESLFIFEKNSGEKKNINFNDFKLIFRRNSINI